MASNTSHPALAFVLFSDYNRIDVRGRGVFLFLMFYVVEPYGSFYDGGFESLLFCLMVLGPLITTSKLVDIKNNFFVASLLKKTSHPLTHL